MQEKQLWMLNPTTFETRPKQRTRSGLMRKSKPPSWVWVCCLISDFFVCGGGMIVSNYDDEMAAWGTISYQQRTVLKYLKYDNGPMPRGEASRLFRVSYKNGVHLHIPSYVAGGYTQ